MAWLRLYISSALDRRPCALYTLPMLLYVLVASRLVANASSPSTSRLMAWLRLYISSALDRRPCALYTLPMLLYVLVASRLVANASSPSTSRLMAWLSNTLAGMLLGSRNAATQAIAHDRGWSCRMCSSEMSTAAATLSAASVRPSATSVYRSPRRMRMTSLVYPRRTLKASASPSTSS